MRLRGTGSSPHSPLTRHPLSASWPRLTLLAIVFIAACCTSLPSSAPTESQPSSNVPTQQCVPKPEGNCQDLKPPRLLSRAEPHYPSANGQKVPRGRVILEGNIGSDGVVTNLHVVASDDFRLNPPSVAAVGLWRYEPAECDGRPVITALSVTVAFNPGGFESKIPIPSCEWK